MASKSKPVIARTEVEQIARSTARLAAREASTAAMRANEDQIKRVVKATITEMFTTMGLDISDPLKVQADFAFLRTLHEGSISARARAWSIFITTLITASIIALLLGLGVPKTVLHVFGLGN